MFSVTPKADLKLILVGLIFIFSGCKKSNLELDNNTFPALISRTEIDAFIKNQLYSKYYFEWSSASTQMIWSAGEQSDHIFSIGYQLPGFKVDRTNIYNVNLENIEWQKEKNQLLQMILISEQRLDPSLTLNKIIAWDENVLPVIDVTLRNPQTLKLLIANNDIRYVEPMGYEPEAVVLNVKQNTSTDNGVASSSGCGSNTATLGLLQNVDYATISPAAKQSWNYTYHNIPKAWSKATGKGVKVFIIDTGCEFDQENLGTSFNQGSSTGRTIEKIVTLPRETFLGIPIGSVEIPDDGCGHGTAMAGACAAPRGTDGNACGVAYNCNLVTCRASSDVYLDESREVKGAADAFTNAANRSDVKVISMSMGKITSSSQLQDAILFAYGKNKLIFCAAGTSFSWTSGWFGVIFPAWMSEVNAVTGVKDNNFNNTCADCHSGSETDFTIVMERNTDQRKPLTLAMSGDIPSTIGGSSVSTATAAGIAALVWSKYTNYSRDQILNKLIQSSANYPNRNSSLGWGNLNAEAAVN